MLHDARLLLHVIVPSVMSRVLSCDVMSRRGHVHASVYVGRGGRGGKGKRGK